MTAPLAGALLYIAQSGDGVRGGLALFSLGLGSWLTPYYWPLPSVCAGYLNRGKWMQNINRVFGYVLLATAIVVLRPVVPGPLFLGLWGVPYC